MEEWGKWHLCCQQYCPCQRWQTPCRPAACFSCDQPGEQQESWKSGDGEEGDWTQVGKETNICLVDLLSETRSCHIDRERWTLLYKEARPCCFDLFMLADFPSATWWVQRLTTLEGIMLQWLQGQGEFLYKGQVFFPRLNQTLKIPWPSCPHTHHQHHDHDLIMIINLLSTTLRDVDTETGKKLGDPSFLAASSQEQVRLCPKSIKKDVYHS